MHDKPQAPGNSAKQNGQHKAAQEHVGDDEAVEQGQRDRKLQQGKTVIVASAAGLLQLGVHTYNRRIETRGRGLGERGGIRQQQ